MADLLELAERCEQADGPDRELDAAIAAAAHLKQLTYAPGEWLKDPDFTASLDMAMALVPEGWDSGHDTRGMSAWVRYIQDGLECARYVRNGATPALALCAAALRARAAMEQTKAAA